MKRLVSIIACGLTLAAVLLYSFSCSDREPLTLTVIETCDLHGVVDERMGAVAAHIEEVRNRMGKNLLLLDGGDSSQGSSTVFFFNTIDTTNPHIFATIFNHLDYDAITVGNHDFEVGEDVYNRVYKEMKMPVLSANIINSKSGKPAFKPYTVINRQGYKIAILGLTTKYALEWLSQSSRIGFSFQSLNEAARYWLKEIEEHERPDVVIGLFHSGYYDEAAENIIIEEHRTERYYSASWVARNVPGFDLICAAHTHELKCGSVVNIAGDTVHIMEAGSAARGLAQAEIEITPVKKGKPKVKITTSVVETAGTPPDEKYMALVAPYIERANEYDRTPICYLATPICSNDEVLTGGSQWVELLHQSLRDATSYGEASYVGVDITVANASIANAEIKKGLLTFADCVLLYPYQNTVSICEFTGEEIKQYLEYVYDLRLSKLTNTPIYYFDSMDGLIYTVDRSKPKGERITIKGMSDGTPFYPTRRYHVAMNSFRAQDGGGILSAGLGWGDDQIKVRRIWESKESWLELMVKSFTARIALEPQPATNWKYE